MPSCNAPFSYLGNNIEQNSKVNISGYNEISIKYSSIRIGNPYFEVKGYSGTKNIAFGFKVNNGQILLYPYDKTKYYIYDHGGKFTGKSNQYFCFPLKHSYPFNETIGVGLCIENKTFVVVHKETY